VARVPDMAKKLDSFLTNLDKAGKGLPGLVNRGEAAFSDYDTTTKAMQRSWLLRNYVPQIQEHTIGWMRNGKGLGVSYGWRWLWC